ncbi:MAG TPA: response regulator transcription factor [Chitinophagaceae bacterium]|nr:response regulator transcription factor [Chitinophagaceae bacterium]HRF18768.1 response regulator transcription factor [Chitinophagaceae bacterium]
MKIVIFEDNKKFRESLEFLIVTSTDMELVGSFEDTNRLLSRIEALQPDVVLMDINIPGKNGIEAVKEIKDKFPDVQVCMQTVFEDQDKIFASLCAGASGYILKNTSSEKILQAIRDVAEGGSFFTPSVAKKVLQSFQQQPEKAEYIQLTDKEKEVLKYLVEGLSYKMIAEKVFLSFHTVHTHLRHIYEKLHVNSKSEAVAKAIKNKLV